MALATDLLHALAADIPELVDSRNAANLIDLVQENNSCTQARTCNLCVDRNPCATSLIREVGGGGRTASSPGPWGPNPGLGEEPGAPELRPPC